MCHTLSSSSLDSRLFRDPRMYIRHQMPTVSEICSYGVVPFAADDHSKSPVQVGGAFVCGRLCKPVEGPMLSRVGRDYADLFDQKVVLS
jgi:hypothetical protein